MGFNTEFEITGNPEKAIQSIRSLDIEGITFVDIYHFENSNGMEQGLHVEYTIDNDVWHVDLDREKVFYIDDYVQGKIEKLL